MKKIHLNKPIVHNYESGSGVYSLMVKPKDCPELKDIYKRDCLGIKLYTHKPKVPIEKFEWGGYSKIYDRTGSSNNLIDCIKIQNLASLQGLAPRVYDIAKFDFRGEEYYGVITDYIEGEYKNDKHINRLVDKMLKYGVRPDAGLDTNDKNCIDGKWVDFQFLRLDDEVCKEYVKKRADDFTDWGSKDFSYENVEELGIKGQRNTQRRAKVLELDKIDFKGKTVLDIGCSTGSFCRYACRRGAARTVGIDIGETPVAAAEISYYLGDFNIDYYNIRLWDEFKKIKELTGIEKYDIVFFLSVNAQIGYNSKYINKICNDYIILEGHSAEGEKTYKDKLEKDFKKVSYKGIMQNNARPAFVCKKS